MKRELSYKKLSYLYTQKHKSAREIAGLVSYSENGVNYWLRKYGIKKRNISEALYVRYNPGGDPFKIRNKFNKKESALRALGLRIYWGEGDKSPNNTMVRVGNTDPFLIKNLGNS